jgi:hypothetical protein
MCSNSTQRCRATLVLQVVQKRSCKQILFNSPPCCFGLFASCAVSRRNCKSTWTCSGLDALADFCNPLFALPLSILLSRQSQLSLPFRCCSHPAGLWAADAGRIDHADELLHHRGAGIGLDGPRLEVGTLCEWATQTVPLGLHLIESESADIW